MSLLIVLLVLLSCQHWSGGLLGFSVWLVAKVREGSPLSMPPFGLAWILVILGLVGGTVLSDNPSGLQWAGLLQWLSLVAGILALQTALRESPHRLVAVLVGLFLAGSVHVFQWTWELVSRHQEWVVLRTADLPLFPFRIRLFGSHGPTQSAAWLGGLILLVISWPQSSPSRWKSIASWSAVSIGIVLMGFCDSRLAYLGFLTGLLTREAIAGGSGRTLWIAPLPAVIWSVRDHLHPSLVVSGGGIGTGVWMLAITSFLPLGWILLRRMRRRPGFSLGTIARIAIGLGGVGILGPAWVAVSRYDWALDLLSSGRFDFWTIAIEAWLGKPLFGIGPWTFVHHHAASVDWTFGFLAMHPHNAFLEILLAGGLVSASGAMILAWKAFSGAHEVEGPPKEWRILLPCLSSLAIGMAFDSPLSSPQVMSLTLVAIAGFLAPFPVASSFVIPRTSALFPLLLLVPASFVWEQQVAKTPLLEARELLRRTLWREGASVILRGRPRVEGDPQWTRNLLMARTMLATSRESLMVLLPQWQRLRIAEPGFLPNRIHLHWVESLASPTKANRDSLDSALARMDRSSLAIPTFGEISSRWMETYPSDAPEFWLGEWRSAKSLGKTERIRWVEHWLDERLPGWRSRISGHRRLLGARSSTEMQLYGSSGTGWLLIPQLESYHTMSQVENFEK